MMQRNVHVLDWGFQIAGMEERLVHAQTPATYRPYQNAVKPTMKLALPKKKAHFHPGVCKRNCLVCHNTVIADNGCHFEHSCAVDHIGGYRSLSRGYKHVWGIAPGRSGRDICYLLFPARE